MWRDVVRYDALIAKRTTQSTDSGSNKTYPIHFYPHFTVSSIHVKYIIVYAYCIKYNKRVDFACSQKTVSQHCALQNVFAE